MAIDKAIDSAQLDADLTSVANAIRTKGGTSAALAFPAGFVSAVEAIETGGGGIEATATYTTAESEISHCMAAYPFIPKSDTELIMWVVQPSSIAPQSGSVTPYAFLAWLIEGNFGTSNRAGWIAGPSRTTPWSGALRFSTRDATNITIDGNGYVAITTGTWGYIGSNQTIKIYEFPFVPEVQP